MLVNVERWKRVFDDNNHYEDIWESYLERVEFILPERSGDNHTAHIGDISINHIFNVHIDEYIHLHGFMELRYCHLRLTPLIKLEV